jgi:WhiB family redox-sensing transcriptional regulator
LETTTPQGACKGFPTHWWFPEINNRETKVNVSKAIDICKSCQLVKQCLDYALRNETHGVWGGMKEVEREIYRRKCGIMLTPEANSSQSNSTRRIRRRMKKEEVNAE